MFYIAFTTYKNMQVLMQFQLHTLVCYSSHYIPKHGSHFEQVLYPLINSVFH